MTIEEDQVMPARQLFGHPLGNDPAIASGPSGCAGLAGLVRLCGNKETRQAVGLDKDARVLLINSEGNLGEGSA
jgi:diaminopropionate ammonia-lyase